MNQGYGFNIGLLHRYNNSFHWGFQYRSKMEIDYGGELILDQIPPEIPPIDARLASSFPLASAIPGDSHRVSRHRQSRSGIRHLGHSWLELDINWTGWSTFDRWWSRSSPSCRTHPIISDLVLHQDWDDVFQYRVGFRWNSSEKSQWRIGYIYDETPQPERTVSPVLPDSNRNDFTFGYGYMGAKFNRRSGSDVCEVR